jgi:signal transduction histidine kinase
MSMNVDSRRMRSRLGGEQLALARGFGKWILAIVSPDIRDPLSAIQLAASVLQSGAASTTVATRQAQTISRAVGGGSSTSSGTCSTCLANEKGQASQSMRAVCERLIDDIRVIATDRQISFDCQADGRGAWDEDRVVQAISNLTTNAVQHGAPGTPFACAWPATARRSRSK